MKSRFGGIPGNTNMRGKKHVRLGCGCCSVQNFKDRELEKEAQKEMIEVSGQMERRFGDIEETLGSEPRRPTGG